MIQTAKTMVVVFDNVNLTTALLARQLIDSNDELWVFMKDNRRFDAVYKLWGGHNFLPTARPLVFKDDKPLVFKDDSNNNSSLILRFCDLRVGRSITNFADRPLEEIDVLIADVNEFELIDRLLNSPRILLTSDSPCSVDIPNRKVSINTTELGWAHIPTDVNYWFISQTIDRFYDFKFGRCLYKSYSPARYLVKDSIDVDFSNMPIKEFENIDISDTPWYGGLIDYESERVYFSIYGSILIDYYSGGPINIFHSQYLCVIDNDTNSDNYNLNLYNKYMKHLRADKKVRYIGPAEYNSKIPLYRQVHVIDLDEIFKKVEAI